MNATPFAARLAAIMIAVVLAASCLTVSLDYLKFRRILRTQEDSVYLFVSADLASTIEDSMNLGLPLAALKTTERVLQRRRVAEAGTLGISVFDSTGTVLFDTDRFRVGTPLDVAWRPAQPDMAQWRGDLPGAYLVGARITNNFGQSAGGVVLRYDPAALETRMNAILLDMVRAALATLVATAVIATLVAILLTRRHNAWFARATAQIAATGPDTAHSNIVPGSEAIMAAIARTTAELDTAEADLIRLGTGEAVQGELEAQLHGG